MCPVLGRVPQDTSSRVGFTPGTVSTFWPAVKFLERAGGLSNLGVTRVFPLTLIPQIQFHPLENSGAPSSNYIQVLITSLHPDPIHQPSPGALVTEQPPLHPLPIPAPLSSQSHRVPPLLQASRGSQPKSQADGAHLSHLISCPAQPCPIQAAPTTLAALLFLGSSKQAPTSGLLHVLFLLLETRFPLTSTGFLSSLFRSMPPPQRGPIP